MAWTGPDPGLKLDLSWKNLIGQASGESYMFEFANRGGKVIVQPSERKSGLNIGIDGSGGRPDIQQNQSLGDAMSNAGNMLGRLGRMTFGR